LQKFLPVVVGPCVGRDYQKEEGFVLPPKVDLEKCTGCGTCADVCPNEVFEVDDKSQVVSPDDCSGCEQCVSECPEEAITMED
jgi:NAD-dependent dihydropyrimidine dehydrogenase PreA subunit